MNNIVLILFVIIPPQGDLEKRLKMKEEEVQFLKQQAEREKEPLKRVFSRDEDHKKQLESVKKVSYVL